MVAEVFGGISAFKSMLDIAKSIKDMADVSARQRVSIELQEQILAAQAAQFALAEQVSDLKAELMKFETWNAEKQRYELKNIGTVSFAYALKVEHQVSQPPHYICARCYEHGEKSILQRVPTNTASIHLQKPPMLRCPECKSEFVG